MEIVYKIRRILKKPPTYIFNRALSEAKIAADRIFNSRPDKRNTLPRFIAAAKAESIESLWDRHLKMPFAVALGNELEITDYGINRPDSFQKILNSADAALQGKLNLLGTGEIYVGEEIIWNKDYKSGVIWQNNYYRDINYVNFNDKSDVKIPWEISRMQWLIPVGQAYLLTKDEKYAAFVKKILTSWIAENPYGHSLNWTCTMEVALRIIVFEYFFYAFGKSEAWKELSFRFAFLKSIYYHAIFTQRNLEKSDVNGNHYVADATGLVFAGLFFEGYKNADKFLNTGWQILTTEIGLQVFRDGVDYEASIPYHRLVTELFFFPALYMKNAGKTIPSDYTNLLINMGLFTKAYARQNGTVPLVGDADDARTLPFGNQHVNDHTYLPNLIGLTFNREDLLINAASSDDEIFWVLGSRKFADYNKTKIKTGYSSAAFPDGGFYIMGNSSSHILVDCGPLGLAGRGGHGHNDLLSFDAMIDGVNLISDCGSYVYTADYIERNKFRSTSYHNTPMIDGEEINRFITPKYLWNLKNDARESVQKWSVGESIDVFTGTHSGYQRLEEPVSPVRSIIFDKKNNDLVIADSITGSGKHFVEIPLHLYHTIDVIGIKENHFSLTQKNHVFHLFWKGEKWTARVQNARISPSYGVSYPSKKIIWHCPDAVGNDLVVIITRESSAEIAWQNADKLITSIK